MEKGRSNALLVKKLSQMGYREKIIKMITGFNQSYINKVINNKLYKDLDADAEELVISAEQIKKIDAVDKILSCAEIYTEDKEQELMYIHLLKFFLVEKETIYKMFPYLTKRKIAQDFMKKNIDILNFDSTLLGIPREIYLDLIIDFFI